MAPKTREMTESVWDAVALVELPAKKYFKIGEVAALVGVEPHVLRYWQTQFRQVRPQKSRSGHRQYRRRDVETLLAIKELLHVQRFTIAGARQALKGAPSTLPRPADDRLSRVPSPAAVAPAAVAPAAVAPAESKVVESVAAAPASVASATVAVAPVPAAPAPAALGHATPSASNLAAPGHAADDDDDASVVEFDVVGLDRDSQLRRAQEVEFASAQGATARIDAVPAGVDPRADSTTSEHLTPASSLRQTPPKTTADVLLAPVSADVPVEQGSVGVASVGATSSDVPAVVTPATPSAASSESAGELELGVPRRRRSLVTQQLGFGFVPTAHEMLVAARREALELLELLDREDAADLRHVPKP